MSRILRRIVGIAIFADSDFKAWLEERVRTDLLALKCHEKIIKQNGLSAKTGGNETIRDDALEIAEFYHGHCKFRMFGLVSGELQEEYFKSADEILSRCRYISGKFCSEEQKNASRALK